MLDMEERKHIRCVACDTRYPGGCGVCPNCGAPPLQATDGTAHRVVVPPVTSSQLRMDLANKAHELLECTMTPDELGRELGQGNSVLCGGLSWESAQALVQNLKGLHISARAEAEGSGPGGSSQTKLFVGIGLVVLGVVLLAVTGGVLRFAGGGIGVLAGLAVIGVHFLTKAQTLGGALCMAPLPQSPLSGWESMPQSLTPLLVGLKGPAHDALSNVAKDVAALQDDLQAGSMAAFAVGGPGGAFEQAAVKLLQGAVARGRALLGGTGDDQQLTAGLQTLAQASARARKQYAALGERAASGSGEDVTALSDGIVKELADATQSLA